MKVVYYFILTSAVVVAVSVHLAFWEKFGTILEAGRREDWGLYGDYIGGTVGTFFSFAALMGVLATLILQTRQIDHMELQSKLEEVQRFVSYAAGQVDASLHRPPRSAPERIQHLFVDRPLPLTIHDMLFAAVNLKLGHSDQIPPAAVPGILDDLVSCLKRETSMIVVELQSLTGALEAYTANRGSEVITSLYRDRYKAVIGALQILDLLCSERVARHFHASSIRNEMERIWRETAA